ncbi:serine hydrolase [Actinomadura sp. 6N118]|uniref:serine hydrolase n=1 Tax=Actinomadura sp. 6N118 TaxID=3375151 RepID=UPI00379D8715
MRGLRPPPRRGSGTCRRRWRSWPRAGVVGGAYVDGRPVGLRGAGSRLLGGGGGRVPADARFRIGSQTKQMAATVVLQLVKRVLTSGKTSRSQPR